VLAAALVADGLLSADRNRGMPAALHLPAGRVVGRDDALALAPELARIACPARRSGTTTRSSAPSG